MSEGFSPAALGLLDLFFAPWKRGRMRPTLVRGLPGQLRADRPLLVVANHASWWDGFLLREVRTALRPRAPIYTLMSEAELRRHPFLRRIGAVGIEPGSAASVLRAIRLLRRRVAARPDSVILFFPQGRIWPTHRRPLGFRRGVEAFARQLRPLTVLPVALHIEPLTAAAPTPFLSAGPAIDCDGWVPSPRWLEARVEEELDGILDHLAVHGEEAAAAWPGEAPGSASQLRPAPRPVGADRP